MFEIVDYKENSYLGIRYVSSVLPKHDIYVGLNFEGEWGEVSIDYGTSEYDEQHTSEDRLFDVANEYQLEDVYFDGDNVILNQQQKELVEKEIDSIFKHFIGETFETLSSEKDLEKIYKDKSKKFSLGGVIKLESIFPNTKRFLNYSGQFIYPPRVEFKLHPKSLDKFDNGMYLGQPKMNGSSCSIILSEKGYIVKERHNNSFAYPPKIDFKPLHRGKGYMCLVGEYMNKSKKDENGKPFSGFIIWDITAFNGKILVGSTIVDRIKLLEKLYPSTDKIKVQNVDYLVRTKYPDVYKVNNFYDKFGELFPILTSVDMVEGFVLKRKSGYMEMLLGEKNNKGWSVKVRKPTKNYDY